MNRLLFGCHALAAGVSVLTLSLSGCSGGLGAFDLREIVDAQTQTGSMSSLRGLEMNASSPCKSVDGCIQEADSPQVRLLRFSNSEAADHFALSQTDVVCIPRILICADFVDPNLTSKAKTEVVDYLDSIGSSG